VEAVAVGDPGLVRRLGALVPPPVRSKVPRIIAAFWVAKLLSTALGESTSDYLVHRFNPYAAVIGGFLLFALALALQFRARAYRAATYWFAVVMVAVFGTMAADVLHMQFGVPYIASTVFFALVLAAVFTLWYRLEGTLSIHSIVTTRRELFYWAAVLATFAMGTAAGDLAAYTFRLGFLEAGIAFAVIFAIPGVYHALLRGNTIAMFWFAYVATRPLGASFADWFGKSRHAEGLGYGDGPVSGLLTLLIVTVVAYLAVTGADVDGTIAA
jgi:uncharacterized membrane-anchored protein